MAGYHISDSEHGPWVVIFAALLMVYAILCYFARLTMRLMINGPFGVDDWAITIGTIIGIVQSSLKISEAHHGLGKRTAMVKQDSIRAVEKLAFAGDILYLIGMALSRIGTFLLIARLTRQKKHLIAANTGAILATVVAVASLFIVSIRCDISKPWTLVPQCHDMYTRWYAAESLGILVELFAAWVPIYLVWSLQMKLQSKLVVLFAFSFRLPVIIVGILRLYYLHQEASHDDPLFYGATSSVCLEFLLHYGLIAATIPCLKPFVKAFNTGYFDTRAIDTSSYVEGYALSNIQRTNYTSTAVAEGGHKMSTKKGSSRRHIRAQPSDDASSAGSDKMIIRQTTGWNVSYDTNDRTS